MPRRSLAERVERAICREPAGCWLWLRAIDKATGYGRVWANGRMLGAHRVVYELYVGPIPEGLTLDHLCRVRHCVNPDHMEPVTLGENLRRGEGFGGTNARKAKCARGHDYDGTDGQGGRRCSQCVAINRENARLRRRARTADGYPPGFWDIDAAPDQPRSSNLDERKQLAREAS